MTGAAGPRQIKLLIVDDSLATRTLLCRIYGADDSIKIVGKAANGEEALRLLQSEKPDVMTTDIHMPVMNGLELIKRAMETDPLPIIVVSISWVVSDAGVAFQCMEAGALAVLEKPLDLTAPAFPALSRKLVESVKSLSEIKVVRRLPHFRKAGKWAPTRPPKRPAVIAIGASTGGPPAIKAVISQLTGDLHTPILIVQHIAAGFLPGLIDWLGQSTPRTIKQAEHGESLRDDTIYVAPDGRHLGVSASGQEIALNDGPIEHGTKPAISALFRSINKAYNDECVAVLLTGMGLDGAQELRNLKDKGALTIAQDKESSVVHGMPGEAIRLGGATFTLSPLETAQRLNLLALEYWSGSKSGRR